MYTKLFQSILNSSIWTEDDQTRIVWITLLAMADKHGEVAASVPGLARQAGVSLEAAERALAKFLAPDPHSRTSDDQGRRIEQIDGGWVLLNHAKYRAMASREDQRKKNAERQRRFRERRDSNAPSRKSNAKALRSNGTVTHDVHIAEAEAEADTKKSTPKPPRSTKARPATIEEVEDFAQELGLPRSDGTSFFLNKEGNGWMNGKSKVKDWRSTLRNWKLNDWLPSQKAQGVPQAADCL